VSVALDGALKREVALKEILHDRAGDPDSRARFLQEAEITGRLEHPGIVPVYALGRHADGRPYYAMRFIRGESLRQAITRLHASDGPAQDPGAWAWELRLLLRRLLDACNAVAYAHSQGVIHRDLKPDNIMLGPYGETLVVDWGLAKVVERTGTGGTVPECPSLPDADTSPALTCTGAVIGTPAYMSPEQASGDPVQVGPASDIYSLGATLLTLLVGHPLSPGSEAVRPSGQSLRRNGFAATGSRSMIPRALEAVCRKAMASRPEDRYSSVRALADDVERWLADEPMAAWRAPWTTRAWRWMRRHRTMVAAAAAALIMGLAALSVGYWRISRSNEQLRLAKGETERRLDQALQANEDYYTGVSQEVLLDKTELRDLRARLLERPRKFYEQLTKELETANDERGRYLLAKGRSGLARILRTLGLREEAKQHLEAAIGCYRELVGVHPNVPDYQQGLAGSYHNLGTVQRDMGELRGADESYRQAIATWSRLLVSQPGIPDYQHGLALSYDDLSAMQSESGDHQGAAVSCQQAIAMYARLVASQPDIPRYQHVLANSYNDLGSVQSDTGNSQGAAESHRQAITILSRLVGAHPNVPDYQEALANSYNNLGIVQSDTGDGQGAAESYHQAIEVFSRLAGAHPNVPDYQDGLAMAYNNLGTVQDDIGDQQSATESHRQAAAVSTKLVATHPNIPDYLSTLAASYHNLGAAYRRTGDSQGAVEFYQKAIAIRLKMAEGQPHVPDYQFRLARSYTNLGKLQYELGELGQAAGTIGRAIEIGAKLVHAHPDVPSYASRLGEAHAYLGAVLNDQARHKEAEQAYRQAIERQKTANSTTVPARWPCAYPSSGMSSASRVWARTPWQPYARRSPPGGAILSTPAATPTSRPSAPAPTFASFSPSCSTGSSRPIRFTTAR
jgi:serine/threonine-protein kinase